MGNSDNRKRGVNSRQNEKNREALISVLTVCLIGVLVTVVIIAAVDLFERYQMDSNPEEVLGKLYYSPKKPSHIGRYGDDSIFVK